MNTMRKLRQWWRRRRIARLLLQEARLMGHLAVANPGDCVPLERYPADAVFWGETHQLVFETPRGRWYLAPLQWVVGSGPGSRMGRDFAEAIVDLLNRGTLIYLDGVLFPPGRWLAIRDAKPVPRDLFSPESERDRTGRTPR